MVNKNIGDEDNKNQSKIKQRMSKNFEALDWGKRCDFPRNMLLEPTNICNHSCLMCANSKGTKKGGIINKNFARRILKEAYELGTREVGFYGMGEPLLDQNLEEYIEYAKELGYEYTYITTNGALLTKERALSLVNAGIDSVKFSINAANSKEYCLIHGKDEFDKVIENLIYFDSLRKKQERKIALYISYIATRYTVSAEEEFKTKYQKYVNDIVFYDCRAAGDMIDELDKYLSVEREHIEPFQSGICPMVFNKLHITYEGFLSMCCDDLQNYLVVADLNKECLEDAWNNQYACDLRKRQLEHNLKGTRCYNCMHGSNEKINPLRSDLAIYFENECWNKEQEIVDRINKWQNS